MIERISAIAPMTGCWHKEIQKAANAKEKDVEKERVKKILEEQRKKVSPLYNSEGKLIEYDNHGRHLDMYG